MRLAAVMRRLLPIGLKDLDDHWRRGIMAP